MSQGVSNLHRTCEVSVNSWVRAKGKTLKTQNSSEFFIILITPSDLSDWDVFNCRSFTSFKIQTQAAKPSSKDSRSSSAVESTYYEVAARRPSQFFTQHFLYLCKHFCEPCAWLICCEKVWKLRTSQHRSPSFPSSPSHHRRYRPHPLTSDPWHQEGIFLTGYFLFFFWHGSP